MITWACGDHSAPDATWQSLPDVAWTHYGGDAGGTRYSPLRQITRANVEHLTLAWKARVGDFPPDVFEPDGHRAGAQREDGSPIAPRIGAPCGSCHETQVRFETTPLMLDGTMIVGTPLNRIVALDPATGEVRWTFDSQIDRSVKYREGFTARGVAAWSDPTMVPEAMCGRRILLATLDGRVLSRDAATGEPCREFGSSGTAVLRPSPTGELSELHRATVGSTSPPAVIGDIIVIGSVGGRSHGSLASRPAVWGLDARTGAVRWSFPPTPHPGQGTAPSHGASVWAVISTDSARGMVFLPTASGAPAHVGIARPGRNKHANAVVALDAFTGRLLWSHQLIHHDLWDYDVAAQPLLMDVVVHGATRPVVVAASKAAVIHVLDRATGVPISRAVERRVPDSDVSGEAAWPTQLLPETPEDVHGRWLTLDSLFGATSSDLEYCRTWWHSLRYDGPFTPPSERGSVVWPGTWGGMNWSGMAWDPSRQMLVMTIVRLATVVQLHRRGATDTVPDRPGRHSLDQEGTPFVASRAPFVAASGVPCSPPPWGMLVALHVPTGHIRWKRPLGTVPSLSHLRGHQQFGSLAFGGPLITAGGLVFVGGSQDDRFRAFDIDTGEMLWEVPLPAGGQATPMTYRYQGRQYVAIAAGGRGGIGSPGDWIVAFALPRDHIHNR